MTEKSENKDDIQRTATMDKPVDNPDEDGIADKEALKKMATGKPEEGEEQTDQKDLDRQETAGDQNFNEG